MAFSTASKIVAAVLRTWIKDATSLHSFFQDVGLLYVAGGWRDEEMGTVLLAE